MKNYLVLYTDGYQVLVEADDVVDAIGKADSTGWCEIKLVLLVDSGK